MAVISDCVEIGAPASDVWAVLKDVKRLPDYSTSTVAMVNAPDCLERNGQRFTQVVKALGKRWTSDWTVLEFEPEKLLRTQGSVGPGVKFCLTQQLEPTSKGTTTLRLTIQYDVPGGALGRAVSKAGLEGRAKKEASAIMNGIRAAAEDEAKTSV